MSSAFLQGCPRHRGTVRPVPARRRRSTPSRSARTPPPDTGSPRPAAALVGPSCRDLRRPPHRHTQGGGPPRAHTPPGAPPACAASASITRHSAALSRTPSCRVRRRSAKSCERPIRGHRRRSKVNPLSRPDTNNPSAEEGPRRTRQSAVVEWLTNQHPLECAYDGSRVVRLPQPTMRQDARLRGSRRMHPGHVQTRG